MIGISLSCGSFSNPFSRNRSKSVLTQASRIRFRMIPALFGVFLSTKAANCGGIGIKLQILMSVEVRISVGSSPDSSHSMTASIDGTEVVEILKSWETLMLTAVPRLRAPMMPMQLASSFSCMKCKEWREMTVCFSPDAIERNESAENSCAKRTTLIGSDTRVG